MSVSNLQNSRKLPVIAVVGRPNVGKSTFFNRLIGKRRAITDPTPGVTRDPVESVWEVDGRAVLLIDTGGVKLEYKDFDKQVSDKSREVISRADCIVLMLDVTEVTPEDEDLMAFLRPYKDKVFIAVNKVDNDKREQAVWEYHSFGYDRIYPISAAHGLGTAELTDALFEFLPESVQSGEEQAVDKSIRIAVLGKPNTGKSTLLNTLTNSQLSIVSDIPGTTRDVIEGRFLYKNTEYTILDTAGIRRKSKVTENVEYYSVNRAIKTIDEADVVLLMVDTLEGVTDQDKKIAGLIVKKGKGVIIVLNKWDLLDDETGNQLEAMKDRIGFVFPILSFAPIVPISALEGKGIEELLNSVFKVWKELSRRIDTSTMNKHLEKWLSYNPPPRWTRGQYKIRYMTQVSSAPVEFAIFVNRVKGFPAFYVQYIKNRIRKDLGFPNVPIEIHVRG